MDLRAPLHDDDYDDNVEAGIGSSRSPPSTSERRADRRGETSATYRRITYNILCRMHVASRVMGLGSESRFTGLVLFHRYVRRFYRLVRRDRERRDRRGSAEAEEVLIKNHLGTVASACLFLGCKMEEESRRIRDVLNLSHLLKFSTWDDDGGGDCDSADGARDESHSQAQVDGVTSPITIVESPRPPPLDESYWTAKERLVSMEQHVLRMIRFDTTVSHPHRCVLTVMETLGFGAGEDGACGEGGERGKWLLSADQSEKVILGAWRILNEVALDPDATALQYPVIVLSCASISLAAEGGVENEGDEGKAVVLPGFWWRALDVATKDITEAICGLKKLVQI